MIFLWMLFIFEIVLFLFAFYINRQDIMAPSVIMCAVFTFSTALTICNGNNWNINYDFRSFILLFTGLLTFVLVDGIVAGKCKRTENQIVLDYNNEMSRTIDMETWKIIFVILVDLVIVYMYYKEIARIAGTNSYFNGMSISYAYRMIVSHGTDLSSGQYMKGYVTQLSKVVIVSGFVSAYIFVNNVFACRQKIHKNLPLLIPTIIMCIMTLLSGVRTNILRLICFMLITSYILIQAKQGWKTSWKFVRILGVVLIAVLIVFGFSQSLLGRSGSTLIFTVISNYAGAAIQHFNQYIQEPPAANEIFGQETLAGFWNALYKIGLMDKSYSAMEEYRYLNSENFGNVYTFFRRFLQDFGVLGMYIATSIFSFFISFIYNGMIKGRKLTYKSHILIIEYGYLFYIVALSSIDNVVSDYTNLGMIVLIILLHLYFFFVDRFKVNFYSLILVIKRGRTL